MDFQSFAERKTRAAEQAVIPPLVTIEDRSSHFSIRPLGTAWTRQHFDGDFALFDPPRDRPAVSLVFVQSRDGNTVVPDPATLGGGPVDFHLIYEHSIPPVAELRYSMTFRTLRAGRSLRLPRTSR